MMAMNQESKANLDVLGIKPFGDAVNKLTEGMVDGAAAFLSRICLPAATEFGLLLRDKVRKWRTANIVKITDVAQKKLDTEEPSPSVHAPPRLVSTIVENGSWVQDSVVQDLWGGLLSSSCTTNGDDDSNLIFVNILSQMTKVEARIIKYACDSCGKVVYPNKLISANQLLIDVDELASIAQESDIYRLDYELDHLRNLGMLNEMHGGFRTESHLSADITPSPLALQMYVRCMGSRRSPIEYFKLSVPVSSSDAPPGDNPVTSMEIRAARIDTLKSDSITKKHD